MMKPKETGRVFNRGTRGRRGRGSGRKMEAKSLVCWFAEVGLGEVG